MKAMKVDKAELLNILQKNRDKHRAIFEEALEGYKKEVIALLEKKLATVKRGKIVSHIIRLETPRDQTKDYDRVIGMLNMSTETEVELTEQDYSQYVLDDWTWKNQFLHSNSFYSKTAADIIEAASESESD